MQLTEMDDRVRLADQLSEEVGPVILINTFHVAPEDVDALLEAWAADAAYLKQQPGFISAQLHRGIAGSGVFCNLAVWESVAALREAWNADWKPAHGRRNRSGLVIRCGSHRNCEAVIASDHEEHHRHRARRRLP